MRADPPSLLVGILLAVYWLRVLHLARKIHRQARHSANIIPPDLFGCLTRAIWFPVVILWIAIPLWVPFIDRPPRILQPLLVSPLLAWAGVAVAVAAFILTSICWKKMGSSWRMGIDPLGKNRFDRHRPLRPRPTSDLRAFIGADAGHRGSPAVFADDRRCGHPSRPSSTRSAARRKISFKPSRPLLQRILHACRPFFPQTLTIALQPRMCIRG